MTRPDLEFFFDPSCPFCWVTSKWVRVVRDEIGIAVRWSYISLLTLNSPYDEPGGTLERWHLGGRRMQRVVAAAAERHGAEVVGPLYEAIGTAVWESSAEAADARTLARAMSEKADLGRILASHDLDADLAEAVDDDSRDHLFDDATAEALSRTGEDVGTPIITFDPDGDAPASFFGPVLSAVPAPADSVAFFRALRTAARIPGFTELKRTKRDQPRLPLLEGPAT